MIRLNRLDHSDTLYQRYDDDHSGGGGGSSKEDVPHIAPRQKAPETESRSDAIERLKEAKRNREKKS
jgi:hypothetical protein